MSWSNKAKVLTKYERSKLLTPDSNQILVGSSEDLVLIFQEEDSFWNNDAKVSSGSWSNRSKTSASWTNKTKISS